MKIIVYNYKDQSALSRGQIETIKSIMPKEYFAPILELHLTYDTSKPSMFEYSYKTKQAFFALPVKAFVFGSDLRNDQKLQGNFTKRADFFALNHHFRP